MRTDSQVTRSSYFFLKTICKLFSLRECSAVYPSFFELWSLTQLPTSRLQRNLSETRAHSLTPRNPRLRRIFDEANYHALSFFRVHTRDPLLLLPIYEEAKRPKIVELLSRLLPFFPLLRSVFSLLILGLKEATHQEEGSAGALFV